MLCFKDRTFCPFFAECWHGDTCSAALTDEVKREAERWMKDALVCVFSEKPECFRELS